MFHYILINGTDGCHLLHQKGKIQLEMIEYKKKKKKKINVETSCASYTIGKKKNEKKKRNYFT